MELFVKITTRWQKDLTFVGTNEKNQSITMDGEGNAPSPMQLILMGVGGCSSIDIVLILKKARQNIADCICQIEAERAETDPKVFTKIHAHYQIIGKELKVNQVERAVKLSMEKYCSASIMLSSSVDITHSFEVIEE